MLTVSEERDDYCLLMIDAAEMKWWLLSVDDRCSWDEVSVS